MTPFSNLGVVDADPLIAVMRAFRSDPSPSKVDLGVGVFRDDAGTTPIMQAVLRAEAQLLAEQTTKSYVGPAGNPEFNEAIRRWLFGPLDESLRERTAVVQAVGGSGALHLAARLLFEASSAPVIHVSDPTWPNHRPLLVSAGAVVQPYPYYDARTAGVRFAAMLETLERTAAGQVVLLHGCCHNPTGLDLTPTQWTDVADVLERRRLLPLIDVAYLGLGSGIEEDALGTRCLVERLPATMIAVSCAKNFGLYRERPAALLVTAETPAVAARVQAHLERIVRALYSMPPDHGAATVATILADGTLRGLWQDELAAMRSRLSGLRAAFSSALVDRIRDPRFAALASQQGLFSLLPLSAAQCRRLRESHHVYLPDSGRINIAGLTRSTMSQVADVLSAVWSTDGAPIGPCSSPRLGGDGAQSSTPHLDST